jgi:CheY-like chemotaxis protein
VLDRRQDQQHDDLPERHRPLVLMVDDDRSDRELYGTILCYNGFDVLLAGTGTDAVRQARRFAPDCVLLDLGLPERSGLEVAAELKSDPTTGDVPLIVLSGYSRDSMGARALAAGCTAYIEKPTEPTEVLRQVEAVTGRPPLSGVGDPPRILGPLD